MNKLQDNMSNVSEAPITAGTYGLLGLYMFLLAINAVLLMTGSQWSTLNAAAVIALGAGLWYAT